MKKKYLIIPFLSLLAPLGARAQFYLGGGAAANIYSVGLFPAVQPRIGVDYKEGRASLSLGFNLSPVTQKNKFNAVFTNSDGTEKTSVLFTERLTMQNGFFHFAYRLGNMEKAFRFKLIGGASVDLIKVKYKTDRTLPQKLTSDLSLTDISATGPKVDIGVGADIRSSKSDDVYIEVIAGLPANQVNGQYISNPTVAHIGITVGYSHYFGKREYTGLW